MSETYLLNGKTVYPVNVPTDIRSIAAQDFIGHPSTFSINWDKYMIAYVPGQGDQLIRKSKIKIRKEQ